MNARQKDPAKEAALWAAIRALDSGSRRAVEESAGTLPLAGSAWHEKDARRILFLKYRYDAGEWQGEADCWQPEISADTPPVLVEASTS